MKKLNAALFVFVLMLGSTTIVQASDLANGISLRNRHYYTRSQTATPKETFYVAGRYIIMTSKSRYVGSCSPRKQRHHQARIAAYNYQNYMD